MPKDPERDRVIIFGPFRLFVRERRLEESGRPVHLGSRALDILIALLAHPGELVSKRDLMRIVWPDTVVVEANLSVHVAALRRALGDGDAGSRCIVNIPGRGYRFIAPVTLDDALPFSEPSRAESIQPHKWQVVTVCDRADQRGQHSYCRRDVPMSEQAHILVVDDDRRIRTMLNRYLADEGFRVSEASDGEAMRSVLARDSVDLVLLDLVMPGEDGLTLARQIRQRSEIPVIMLTGKGELIDRVVGLEAGADDYIAKPFHLREVLARIRTVIRRVRL